MKKNNKAFSILEVIVATAILTLAVFGINKLILENTKIINNNNNYNQLNNLFLSFEECIINLGYNNLINANGTSYNFNFGDDYNGCFTGSTNEVVIDNIKYNLIGTISDSTSKYIDWDIKIETDGIGEVNKDFILIKK